jgi:hypothetical protein
MQRQHPRNSSYILTVQNLTLTAKVRAILIDWLVEVALEFDFRDETLYFAVALVDMALSKFRVRSCACMCACVLCNTPQSCRRRVASSALTMHSLLAPTHMIF